MVKTTFKDRASTVVKGQIDVERSKKKTVGSRRVAAALKLLLKKERLSSLHVKDSSGRCVCVCYRIILGSRIW